MISASDPRVIKLAAVFASLLSDNHNAATEPAISARRVTVKKASQLTGYTEKAIRHKIANGTWLEGEQWHRVDGSILIDMEGYEKWAGKGTALKSGKRA